MSDEHLVGYEVGLLQCRSVRRTYLEYIGSVARRVRHVARCGILTWKWTLGVPGPLEPRQQEDSPTIPPPALRHNVTVKNPRCADKKCTQNHLGPELSGVKSAELLDALYARLPVWRSRTLANAEHFKIPGRRVDEKQQHRK